MRYLFIVLTSFSWSFLFAQTSSDESIDIVSDVVAKGIYAHKQTLKKGDSIAIQKSFNQLHLTQKKIDTLFLIQTRTYHNATSKLTNILKDSLNTNIKEQSDLTNLLLNLSSKVTNDSSIDVSDVNIQHIIVNHKVKYQSHLSQKRLFGLVNNKSNVPIEIILKYSDKKNRNVLTKSIDLAANDIFNLNNLTEYQDESLKSLILVKYYIFYPVVNNTKFFLLESNDIEMNSEKQDGTLYIEIINSNTPSKEALPVNLKDKNSLLNKILK